MSSLAAKFQTWLTFPVKDTDKRSYVSHTTLTYSTCLRCAMEML